MRIRKTLCLLSAAAIIASCEKNEFDMSKFTETSIIAAKPLNLSAGKATIVPKLANCFFGDLDAARMDSELNGKKSFIFTVEKIEADKNQTLLSKPVNINSFDKGVKLNTAALKDGVYGVFICSDPKGSCISKSKEVTSVNRVVMDYLVKKGTKKSKVYSANFFMKFDGHILGQQMPTDPKNLEKSYLEVFNTKFKKEEADKIWGKLKHFFEILMPMPLLTKEPYENPKIKFDANDILIPIPKLDSEACDEKQLIDLYKKQMK